MSETRRTLVQVVTLVLDRRGDGFVIDRLKVQGVALRWVALAMISSLEGAA